MLFMWGCGLVLIQVWFNLEPCNFIWSLAAMLVLKLITNTFSGHIKDLDLLGMFLGHKQDILYAM